MRSLSLTARGCLPPLVTTIGGFAAQEAIIALTGKFSPLHQWVSIDQYMRYLNHETLKATHPRQSFSKKNELPQVGLKP